MGYSTQDSQNQKPLKYGRSLHYFLGKKKRCIQELRGIHPITGKPPFWEKGWFRRSNEHDQLILKACLTIKHLPMNPLERENYEANVTNLRQTLLKKASVQSRGKSQPLDIRPANKRQSVIPKNEFLVYHGMQDLALRVGMNPSSMSLEEIVNHYRKVKGFSPVDQTINLISSKDLQKLTKAGYGTENIYRFLLVYHYTHCKTPHAFDAARKNHLAPEHIIDAVLRWESTGELVDPYHS